MATGIIIGLLLGCILGAAVLHFLSRGRTEQAVRAVQQERENDRRDWEQRLGEQVRNAEVRQREAALLISDLSNEQQRSAALNERVEGQKAELDAVNLRAAERDRELLRKQDAIVSLNTDLAKERERNAGLEQRLAEQKAELETLNQRMTQEFKLIADRLMEEKGKQLNERQKETLEHVLNPLKERIKDFEEQVRKSYAEESSQRFALKGEVEKLLQQNMRLSQDADNLTKALKGDSKTQGDWGEMILERLLDSSGLVLGEEYSLQDSNTLEDGSRLRPDAVINLPGGKHIIIDAKVSLTHYERYVAATDDAERERMAKAHTDSMRAHMKGLSQKDYPKLFGISSPEFVFMFVPIESAFFLAQNTRRELMQEAIDQRIYVVTHSTLLASLKLFHSIWKNERI
ncbi:MAG TPA: DNA recombination protein RmuC, partial [Flavobacteriales bacterium]